MPPVAERRCPVDLPGPDGDNSIAREPLWHAFGLGCDRPRAPSWTWTEEPPPDTHVPPPPPAAARGGTRTPLPCGTVELLERMPYPAGRLDPADGVADPVAHALVTAFGPQRREPENPYNDHRCYPSPRCLFPVQAFVSGKGSWRLLEPERHALAGLPGAGDAGPDDPPVIALVGRYTQIPAAYKWFRGSLVALELGIVLRSLCVGLELFGMPGRLLLPDGSRDLLAALGLLPTWEWSLPLAIEVGAPGPARIGRPAAGPLLDTALKGAPDTAPEAALADLVRVNRTQDFCAAPASLGPAIPPSASPDAEASSWAELLWNRNSGRMPRSLHGMSGRRRQLPANALHDALRWLETPPPGDLLRDARDAIQVTAVVQGVDEYADGIYRVRPGEAVLHTADPTAAQRLEEQYGYPLTPGNGCDIRHASMIWFFSIRPRQVFQRFGPGGWSAVHYACGWATQGLCLSAAAAGLFARPVRAFKEIPAQHILRLEPDEMIVLSVVAGAPRYASGVLLDLRL